MKLFLALLASVASTDNCTKAGCFFSYQNGGSCRSGGSFHGNRCGEVDAAPHIPDDMWNDQRAIDAYVQVTIEFYNIAGADNDCHLNFGPCDHDPAHWIKNGTSTKKVSWTGGTTAFSNFCVEKCGGSGAKHQSDDPKHHKYCSLCGSKYNDPVTIDYWYPLNGPGPSPGPAPGGKNIVDLAIATPDLSTLVTALKAGKLVDTLSGTGPFTVFAPTNEAFAKLPAATLAHLLDPKNIKELDDVLTYHVIGGAAIYSKDLKPFQKVKTVEGNDLKIVSAGRVIVNNATVTSADNAASNGVVHIIDSVLIPPAAPPPAHACKSTEYCCPDAKRCVTPTKTACEPSNSNAECKHGDVCCPMAKICVTPGAACKTPCGAGLFCSGVYNTQRVLENVCLHPDHPGHFCNATGFEGLCPSMYQRCCPLTSMCVSIHGTCTPP
jgi:hypothetical protein